MPTPRYLMSRIALATVSPIWSRGGGVERGRGAFLPDLLVAALQRAVALAEMDGAALAVAEHLDFDVARPLEIFFQIERIVAERGLGFGARGRPAPTQARSSARTTFMPRPPPPAAALSSTGKPMSRANRRASSSEPTPPSEPGTTGMPSSLAVRLAAILSPIRRICSARGPMKCTLCSAENFGKARVLGEKAVARMHGVGAGDLAGGEQRRNVEIAVLGRRRADADALVGEPHMHGVGVGGRMHRDRRRCRAPCRRAAPAARSRRGWRSGFCRTSARPALASAFALIR